MTTKKRNEWSPWRLNTLRKRLEQGQSMEEIAEAMRCTVSALSCARQYYNLGSPPAGRMTLAEAARELEMTTASVHQLVRYRGMKLGKWGAKYVTLTTEQVEALKARQILTSRPEGYVTAEELAPRWKVSVSYVRRLLADAPALQVRDGNRPTRCYLEREAERYRPPASTGAVGLTPVELATILGCTPSAVSYCRRHAGMPAMHAKLRRGSRWAWLHDPHAVLRWLEDTNRTKWAAAMRAYLEQDQRSAA